MKMQSNHSQQSFFSGWSGRALLCTLLSGILVLGPLLFTSFTLLSSWPDHYFWEPEVWLLIIPLGWLLSGLAWVGLQAIFPMLAILVFQHERLREPRRVIRLGEVFRKLGLTSPEVILVQGPLPSLLQGQWGFFSMPRPFGAILLVQRQSLERLSANELDQALASVAVEARHHRGTGWLLLTGAWLTAGVGLGGYTGASLADLLGLDHIRLLSIVGAISLGGLAWWNNLQWLRLRRGAIALRSSQIFGFSLEDLQTARNLLAQIASFDGVLQPLSPWEKQDENLLSDWHLDSSQSYSAARLAIRPAVILVALGVVVAGANHSLRIDQLVDLRPPQVTETPLLRACKSGDLQKIYEVLSGRLERIDHQDELGKSCLFYALDGSDPDRTLKYVLLASPSLLLRDQQGRTALDYAREKGLATAAAILGASEAQPILATEPSGLSPVGEVDAGKGEVSLDPSSEVNANTTSSENHVHGQNPEQNKQ